MNKVDASGAVTPEAGKLAANEVASRTITVAELAAYIVARDTDIATNTTLLEAERPDRFSSPAAATAWAGEIGKLAGRRAELVALAQKFMPAGAEGVAAPAIPPGEERFAG
jgi:hypothetical protein